MAGLASLNREEMRFDVRLIPVGAGEIQTLESLQRAFSGVAEDSRDSDAERDDRIAGGLFRLSSTLGMLEHWRNASQHVAVVEAQRHESLRRAGTTSRSHEEVES